MDERHLVQKPRANRIISAVLGILMFILVSAFITLVAIREANTARIIQNTDVAGVLAETGMSNLLVDIINRMPFVESYVELHDIEELIRNEIVAEEISRAVNNYLDAFAAGDMQYHITHDEMLDIARNLEPQLNLMFDHEMTEADYGHLSAVLDGFMDFSIFSIENMAMMANVDLTIPQFVVSTNWMILVIVSLIIVTVLMVLHHRKNITDVLKNAGVPILLSGIVNAILGFLLSAATFALGDFFYVISVFLSGTANIIITYSLYAVGVAMAMIILKVIVSATKPRGV